MAERAYECLNPPNRHLPQDLPVSGMVDAKDLLEDSVLGLGLQGFSCEASGVKSFDSRLGRLRLPVSGFRQNSNFQASNRADLL